MQNFLTDTQLQNEISRCEYCEEKPCKKGCPVDCSPADFIMAAKRFEKQDFQRSAAIIMGSNPLGGVCGYVCPDYHCMKECVHKLFDRSINIPAVQATIIKKAKHLGSMPEFLKPSPNNKNIAIIGAGPAGLGAASVLIQKGYKVDIYEKNQKAGGMCNLIPVPRLDKSVLETDIDFLMQLGDINFYFGRNVNDIKEFSDYDSVIISAGLDIPYKLNITGEQYAYNWQIFLENINTISLQGKSIAVIGGGAIAIDVAMMSKIKGASNVEIFSLEKYHEMPLTQNERELILKYEIGINGRCRVDAIEGIPGKDKDVNFIEISKVILSDSDTFQLSKIITDENSTRTIRKFDIVVTAIGSKSSFQKLNSDKVFYAGDIINGPKTVVEAVASGKNCAAKVDAYLNKKDLPQVKNDVKSNITLEGKNLTPISLKCDFFGREILSPFLLSAAPPSDGYEQMRKAYLAGWAGGVMKTAFDNVDIHIPSEYMFAVTKNTYGNCDNVSGHSLDRVCDEIKKLINEFPDRLTLASTGGPVTGDEDSDKNVWQMNTLKLEESGVMGIEYSLSCPQGGDGTKGDIVSQDAELTAKIIDWVMEISNPDIPKLFKLTAAVTSIYPILASIKKVFEKYHNKKAGVTLANTFPAMSFRNGKKSNWDEGIIIGLSGEGVIPISNLTLANAARHGLNISGNGGPMDYKAAADFLALGVTTVQFCTVVMKYGYHIIDELHSGLSYLLKEKSMTSVKDLIGCALPSPITGFMEITSKKKISDVIPELCLHCGNCSRCSYLAINYNEDMIPLTDASKCIGCSICAQKCFSGALFMRDRTREELEILIEE